MEQGEHTESRTTFRHCDGVLVSKRRAGNIQVSPRSTSDKFLQKKCCCDGPSIGSAHIFNISYTAFDIFPVFLDQR